MEGGALRNSRFRVAVEDGLDEEGKPKMRHIVGILYPFNLLRFLRV